MSQLVELMALVKFPSTGKIKLIEKAYYFAENAHKGVFRKSGEPYFNHVVETAKILAELGLGRRTISAGLLHDVLEDADITPEDLEKEFGREIAFLVEGVTKLGAIRYTEEQQRHVESLRKLFVAMSKDLRVLVIKLADRLHNMRTLEHLSPEKRRKIAMETMEVYIPLAYRLGIRKVKRELEDLAFKHIYPEEYEHIKNLLNERQNKVEETALEKIRRRILKEATVEHIKNVTSDVRVKSFYSTYRKIQAKNINVEKIYDIAAIRVQVKTITDCYRMLGIIHSLWRPLPGRIKDYIAFPKPNGYQSLHTTVFVGDGNLIEIQIRTSAMHEHAEFGLASHIAYKESDAQTEDPHFAWFKQFFPPPKEQSSLVGVRSPHHIPKWVSQLVDLQAFAEIPTEFMDNLKSDFFQHRMFIFNTKGEVVDLPIESTPVDFAYEMLGDAADRMFGSKVNSKLVPFDTKLKNGDIVEILTKPSAKPNANWLDYCKTIKAKRLIKLSLEKDNTEVE